VARNKFPHVKVACNTKKVGQACCKAWDHKVTHSKQFCGPHHVHMFKIKFRPLALKLQDIHYASITQEVNFFYLNK